MKETLYRVSVKVELVVAARSLHVAEDLACTLVRCEDGSEPCAVALPIATKADLPNGWDVDCIPFGGDDEREIREYLRK